MYTPTEDQSTPLTTAPSSPKIGGALNLLPSPFFPRTLLPEGTLAKYDTPALPAYYPPLPSPIRPAKADEKDKGTPDEWIVRDESLVRLTGKWPFNCEAALPDLWQAVSCSSDLTDFASCLQYIYPRGAIPTGAYRFPSPVHRDFSLLPDSSTFAITVSSLKSRRPMRTPGVLRFLGESLRRDSVQSR
jgi:hypothetical protein